MGRRRATRKTLTGWQPPFLPKAGGNRDDPEPVQMELRGMPANTHVKMAAQALLIAGIDPADAADPKHADALEDAGIDPSVLKILFRGTVRNIQDYWIGIKIDGKDSEIDGDDAFTWHEVKTTDDLAESVKHLSELVLVAEVIAEIQRLSGLTRLERKNSEGLSAGSQAQAVEKPQVPTSSKPSTASSDGAAPQSETGDPTPASPVTVTIATSTAALEDAFELPNSVEFVSCEPSTATTTESDLPSVGTG